MLENLPLQCSQTLNHTCHLIIWSPEGFDSVFNETFRRLELELGSMCALFKAAATCCCQEHGTEASWT